MILEAATIGPVARTALTRGTRARVLMTFQRGGCLETTDGVIVWLDSDPMAFSGRGITIDCTWTRDVEPGTEVTSSGNSLQLPLNSIRFGRAISADEPFVTPSRFARVSPRHRTVTALDPLVDAAIALFEERIRNGDSLESSALPLLGMGPGLTPSGDDFLGGFLWMLRALGRALDCSLLLVEASQRTHAISLARLADHAAGAGTRAERMLIHGLAHQNQELIAAAQSALSFLGHSSGYDFERGARTATLITSRGREEVVKTNRRPGILRREGAEGSRDARIVSYSTMEITD